MFPTPEEHYGRPPGQLNPLGNVKILHWKCFKFELLLKTLFHLETLTRGGLGILFFVLGGGKFP
jgi:hypothetical protein